MKLAANLSLMYGEWAFVERIAEAAQDGFEAVECMFPYHVPAEQLKTHSDLHGLRWALINAPAGDWAAGDRGLACLAHRRDEFREAIDQAAYYAQALAVPCVHVLAGALHPGADAKARDAAWNTYQDNLTWVADTMADVPVTWLVEPINTRDVPGYLLNTQAQAHALVQDLNRSNLGVQMDLYHCQIVEGDVVRKLEHYLPTGRVKHIQIAGVPERHEPSRSELNYPRVFECLKAMGYQGHVGCEYRPQAGTRAGLGWRRML
ncbi:MAG TPA: 2-oxo-tetronate isomerase [Limnobacter sp.]|nr:2-oxo-tetronate isomerase [Limnobacter sp.]